MKIAFFAANLTKGGAERVMSNLANYLSNIDNNIVELYLYDKRKIEYDLDTKIKLTYIIEKRNKNKNLLMKYIRNAFNRIVIIFKFRKKIKRDKPDVIISFLPMSNFLMLIANHKRVPCIVSTRNSAEIEFPNKLYRMFFKKTYPLADGIIFQTREQKEYIEKNIKINKGAIIPNPIDKKFLKIIPQTIRREKIIVSVGRLIPQKNQKLLIKSFIEISNKIPEYKLIIYGEGKLRKELQELIDLSGMSEKILLPGNVDNIEKEIYQASLFVLSSNYEGMPNSLMEAMALGLPCISTDCPCGGPKFLIKDGYNGFLIKVGNIEELKEKMLQVIENAQIQEKFSINANKICKELSPNKIFNEYYSFIKKILLTNDKE